MVCTLWRVAALLTVCLVLTSCSLSPGEQAKVSTALDTAQYILGEVDVSVNDERKAIAEALEVSGQEKTAELLKKQATLLKIGSTIGNVLKVVNAASAIASFVFTFFMPSQMEVIANLINKRFAEVNAKLDDLDEKLDRIEESIKANTAFNVFLSNWIKWEYQSKNGAKKLSDIRRAMGKTRRRVDQVKLAEEFVNYYEYNNLDGNLLNLYRMAALPESDTNRNIFDRFVDEFGCDIGKLSTLMIAIKKVMTSSAQQTLSYYYFKGDEARAREKFNDIQTYFYDIRRAFDDRVWYCRSNAVHLAKKDASKLVKSMAKSRRESVAKAVYDDLTQKYPWYTWAVAAAKDGKTSFQGFEWRGFNYFKLEDASDPDKIKVYYVAYEDAKSTMNCNEIRMANTLMIFRRCESCNSDFIYAADSFLTSKRCGSALLQKVFRPDLINSPSCSKCSKFGDHFDNLRKRRVHEDLDNDCESCIWNLKNYIRGLGFIASSLTMNYGSCTTEKCGHGRCKALPYSRTHQCVCDKFYEGENCENRIEFDDSIETLMSELRREFNVVTGVPTAVDVFFATQDLSKKLDAVLEKIALSLNYTNEIIKHSKIIYNAEDIVDMYTKLKRNELRFNQFGEKLDIYLNTVTNPFELENRLKKMILGKGTLDSRGHDLYNSYKREYLMNNHVRGCSPQYNEDIKGFRDNLAQLDQVVGEALLLHIKWLMETKGDSEELRAKYKEDAVYLQGVFKGRQEEYKRYWTQHSCGPLTVSGTQVNCKSELTYEGMSIPLYCDRQRQPEPGTVTCLRRDGALTWDSQPRCKFVWGSYGAWGICSKTCDGGTMTMHRGCLGSPDVSDCMRDQGGSSYVTSPCNTQDCCSAHYGKFKCSNGRCIQKSKVCDGRDDCGNGDDETQTRCPNFIRSGDMVALENQARRGKWLSCYCTVNCGWKNCYLQSCPGSTMDTGDWDRCTGERFLLYGIERGHGESIRSGDRIGLQYGWDSSTDRGNWLSCWGRGNPCLTRTCPGYRWNSWDTKDCRGEWFIIYAPDRMGSCSGNVRKRCRKGEPIRKGDTVLILYTPPGYWLSEYNGKDIRTRTCPGGHISSSSKYRCASERWSIFSRW